MIDPHLENLGFDTEFSSETGHPFADLIDRCRRVESTGGDFLVWTDETGIEIWLQRNTSQIITGYSLHYAGISRSIAALVGPIWFDRLGPMGGGFHAWSNGKIFPDGEPDGDFPFDFEVPDFYQYDKLQMPVIKHVQLAAFAHDLVGYDDEEEMRQSPLSPFNNAVESFFPAGGYDPIKQFANTYALFTGVIRQARLLTNPLTGRAFHWLLVKSYSLDIDLVASERQAEGSIAPGKIILCRGCLTGRLVS